MSKDWKCPFCGSNKLKVEKAPPSMVKKKNFVWGEDIYEKETDFCCRKMAKNQAYIDARFDSTLGDIPDLDDISEL